MHTAAVLVVLGSCGPTPATLSIEPERIELIGASSALVVSPKVLDRNGRQISKIECSYESSDPSVASILNNGTNGVVSAQNSGVANLAIKCGLLTASIPVSVRLPDKLVIEATCETLCHFASTRPLLIKLNGVGAIARIRAKVLDSDGAELPIRPSLELFDTSNRNAQGQQISLSKDGESRELRSNGAIGRYMLLAVSGKLAEKVAIEASRPNVGVVKVQQESIELRVGEELVIAPRAFSRAGQKLIPIEGAMFRFISSDPKVVTTSSDGRVIAKSEGHAEVLVSADSGAFAQVRALVTLSNPNPVEQKAGLGFQKGGRKKIGKRK